MPWRSIGLALTLIALLLAAAVLVVGTQQRVPAPFGLARTGLVAYDRAGDIYTSDPLTGESTAIVTGPETDVNPRWSRDGLRVAFERKAGGDAGPGLLFVAKRDGSEPALVTPDPISFIENYTFSPDGQQLLIGVGLPFGADRFLIAAIDGSAIRELELPKPAAFAEWRPPVGSEILVMDSGDYPSIYTIDVQSGATRTILDSELGRQRSDPKWSPDGTMISYVEWADAEDLTAETHIMAADGTADRILPIPPDAVWQAAWNWSNDGTRLLAIRGFTGGFEESRAVAIPVDGRDFGIDIDYPGAIQAACCTAWEWAPDDSWILGTPTSDSGAALDQVILDPVAGTSRTLPWTSVSKPSVQRLAP
jgi:dipeptidyl aminopeptidase/acylaminoacyl peptidase